MKMEFRVRDEVDRLTCQKRGGKSGTFCFDVGHEIIDSNLLNNPQYIVQFRDTWAMFKSKLSPIQRKIVHLRLKGESNKRIGQALGIHPSQITRKLKDIQLLFE